MAYETVPELAAGLATYFGFYNEERPHQSLAVRFLQTRSARSRPGLEGRCRK